MNENSYEWAIILMGGFTYAWVVGVMIYEIRNTLKQMLERQKQTSDRLFERLEEMRREINR